MSRGINKTISIGNLCAEPETRYMPSGGAVTNIRLAMNDSYKDKTTGQTVDKVEYMNVVFFNRLAEIAGEYLCKGSKIYIEGSLRTREWEKDGVKRYTTEIVANEMQMLDSKGAAQGADGQGGYQNQAQQQPAQAQAAPEGVGDFDDDIPF